MRRSVTSAGPMPSLRRNPAWKNPPPNESPASSVSVVGAPAGPARRAAASAARRARKSPNARFADWVSGGAANAPVGLVD